MPTIAAPAPVPRTGTGPGPAPSRLRGLGPQWYAAVMGTAIVANAAGALPLSVPGLHALATAVWVMAAALLAAVVAARVAHLVRHTDRARAHLLDGPAVAVFYGCPPMALLSVGHGALLFGPDLVGTRAAFAADAVLWTAGAGYAVAAACAVPYLLITRYSLTTAQGPGGAAVPGWLLPVVAPMVAAALGPPLIPHLPPGQAQATMLYACYALFGVSLLGTLLLLPGIWTRLVHDRLEPATLAPTLFLVLGPLGQSTTAMYQLATAAPAAAGTPSGAVETGALLYGVPVMGFALLWLVLAAAVNVRALRRGMPFAMTWWAYTFPVGTCVTGLAGLARLTGLDAFALLSAALYVMLVAAWAVVGTRTARGALDRSLFA